ncbi:3-hydroxyacyl-CoA dehydrogenase family protein, partial [Sulfobacillus acidophilus]|nr:3-hydroxyacyl-CoA dehydrogenase family protein [Sulfobacillus acidophilus]
MMSDLKANESRALFKKVCVIGAGIMGSGIAAHFANSGIECLLLDVVPKDSNGASRNDLAHMGIQKSLKAKPAAFFSKKYATMIEAGNLEDDLHKVKNCDWVIEAVVENAGIKQELFAKLESNVAKNTIVSSNTSGLSINEMLKGRTQDFKERFLVTHFFNPVRYLHLLELVKGPDTKDAVVKKIAQFGEQTLGKGIVYGKDTPNFVANRIGVFAMMEIMRVMQEDGLSIEEVDAVFGPATGRPKSAVFRTADLVGLDTFIHVANNCYENLPNDERREVFKVPAFLSKMVENGWLGQKSKQGFYKKQEKDILALDYKSLTYNPKQKVRYDSLGAVRNLETVGEKIKFLVN